MTCPHCRANNIETARFCEACGKSLKVEANEGLSGLHTVDPELQKRPVAGEARSPLDLQPGDVFASRYHIVEEIGRFLVGGQGEVEPAISVLARRAGIPRAGANVRQ